MDSPTDPTVGIEMIDMLLRPAENDAIIRILHHEHILQHIPLIALPNRDKRMLDLNLRRLWRFDLNIDRLTHVLMAQLLHILRQVSPRIASSSDPSAAHQ